MTVFTEIVQDIAREQGIDVSSAWVKARQLNPTLYSRLCQGKRLVPADAAERLANDMNPMQMPLPTGQARQDALAQMLMPAHTPDADFEAAVRANHGRAGEPLDAPGVVLGLIGHTAKHYGLNIPESRRAVADGYPDLWAKSGEKLP